MWHINIWELPINFMALLMHLHNAAAMHIFLECSRSQDFADLTHE